MGPVVHIKAPGLGPEGREEPVAGLGPGDNLAQISMNHSEEGGFRARPGMKAYESFILRLHLVSCSHPFLQRSWW